MKTVYVAMNAEIIHNGHINIIRKASELGEVTVGVFTDEVIAKHERLPLLNLEQRLEIAHSLKGVTHVVVQDGLDYSINLNKLRPDYVVHGDDWKSGYQKSIREQVISTLKEWGGELVEPEYTKELSASSIIKDLRLLGTTPDIRRKSLRRLLDLKPIVRVIEAHNGLTGLIAENVKVEVDGIDKQFDAIWESSLTDSTSKGKPDTQAVDISSRIGTIDQILEVTTKPMIVDADNGGLIEHFCFTVRTLERLGVSAVIIEDKVGAKRNSLFGTDVKQTQDSIENFCQKITSGKKAQVTKEFMVISRIESLILKQGIDDALVRAEAYIEAGADAVMIHSKEKTPNEVLEFCRRYSKLSRKVPLVVVPSSYSIITEEELIDAGVSVVIYANHLLRSAFPAMKETAESILRHSRCHEASEKCLSIKEIISLIPESIS